MGRPLFLPGITRLARATGEWGKLIKADTCRLIDPLYAPGGRTPSSFFPFTVAALSSLAGGQLWFFQK